ncbi:hypothetical protein [Actinoplanes sp. NPDC051411]|uniref:hypothetical protein n=1 Tax=Actinoplanes sp. NPDC051411 TaxID=3155522 RepID=UPI0034465EA8
MASPWALDRFGGLTGALSKRLPQALGAALERTFAKRATADAPPDKAPGTRRPALRHTVLFSGSSNQALLDSRWGEPTITDDRY